MKFASLKYDYVFKEVFSYESIRRQFISDVTGIPLESMKEVRLTTPFLWKRYQKQKQGILDVALILNDDTRIDIELQIRPQKYWVKRNLFYLAKMYTEDLRMGQRYERLSKCIAISILDFTQVEGEEYHSRFTLRDRDGKEFTDLFEIHIIEPNKGLKGFDPVDEWIQLMNAETREVLDMIKTQNPGIRKAIEVVKEMNLGKRLRMTFEAYLKEKRDRWAEDEYIRDQGRAEGMVEGRAKGKAEGMVEGRAKGKTEDILQILYGYGEVSEALRERIEAEKDIDTLNAWLLAAARAGSIQGFRQEIKER